MVLHTYTCTPIPLCFKNIKTIRWNSFMRIVLKLQNRMRVQEAPVSTGLFFFPPQVQPIVDGSARIKKKKK